MPEHPPPPPLPAHAHRRQDPQRSGAAAPPDRPGIPVPPPTREPPGWSPRAGPWSPTWGPPPDFVPSPSVVQRLMRSTWPGPARLGRMQARLELGVLVVATLLFIVAAELVGGRIGPPVVGFTLDGERFVRSVLAGLGVQWVFTIVVLAALRPGLQELGVRPERIRQHVGWGIVGAFAMLVVASSLGVLLAELEGSDGGLITDVRRPPALAAAVGLAFLLSATAAITEEIVFRALLLGRLAAAGAPPALGLGVGALVFGALHYSQGALGIAVVTVLGGILGAMLVLRRSLLTGIVAHFMYDLLIFLPAAFLIAA